MTENLPRRVQQMDLVPTSTIRPLPITIMRLYVCCRGTICQPKWKGAPSLDNDSIVFSRVRKDGCLFPSTFHHFSPRAQMNPGSGCGSKGQRWRTPRWCLFGVSRRYRLRGLQRDARIRIRPYKKHAGLTLLHDFLFMLKSCDDASVQLFRSIIPASTQHDRILFKLRTAYKCKSKMRRRVNQHLR